MQPKKPPKSPPPPPAPARRGKVNFSFEFFREREPFLFAAGGESYPTALLARLRDICGMTADALRANRAKGLRYHPIRWTDTTEPSGFAHLNPILRAEVAPFQFSVSANAHGRVHGFWIGDTFYIVWLDPTHALYA